MKRLTTLIILVCASLTYAFAGPAQSSSAAPSASTGALPNFQLSESGDAESLMAGRRSRRGSSGHSWRTFPIELLKLEDTVAGRRTRGSKSNGHSWRTVPIELPKLEDTVAGRRGRRGSSNRSW